MREPPVVSTPRVSQRADRDNLNSGRELGHARGAGDLGAHGGGRDRGGGRERTGWPGRQPMRVGWKLLQDDGEGGGSG